MECAIADARLFGWMRADGRADGLVAAVAAGHRFRVNRTAGDRATVGERVAGRLDDARASVLALLLPGARVLELSRTGAHPVSRVAGSTVGLGVRQAVRFRLGRRIGGRIERGAAEEEPAAAGALAARQWRAAAESPRWRCGASATPPAPPSTAGAADGAATAHGTAGVAARRRRAATAARGAAQPRGRPPRTRPARAAGAAARAPRTAAQRFGGVSRRRRRRRPPPPPRPPRRAVTPFGGWRDARRRRLAGFVARAAASRQRVRHAARGQCGRRAAVHMGAVAAATEARRRPSWGEGGGGLPVGVWRVRRPPRGGGEN
ncbi:hypothetical protein BU14_0127s0016 [Porphyra umbilicalis]|uniref:Uncharacterized protein n=1 Tax=Porphyra umbilicalis TaxID=2786 RepID=A0A1X6PAN6_PORUM|nr:hypothetical protein BU14_0127s0016 [Porphyra umbilicalis]|eukprot:OSX77918.1 hypothetical protein BU14_0127s0016 [Porphyra umbilicalis]